MISRLLDFSFAVVGTELCFILLLAKFALEGYFMRRWFGAVYTKMDLADQRSLTNHVVALIIKGTCILVGAYPVGDVFFRAHIKPFDGVALHGPPRHGTQRALTYGDLLAWCYLTVPTMYIFEIIYRIRISYVSLIHHIASIMITTLGLTIVIATHQQGNVALNEFTLILIYGIFEMIFEVFPHIAIILYRLYRTRTNFLICVFRAASCTIFLGTAAEQIAIALFYYFVWNHWPMSLKVEGIVLHFCFMAAQIHGGRLCWQIARKLQAEKKRDLDGKGDSEATTEMATTSSSTERFPIVMQSLPSEASTLCVPDSDDHDSRR